MDNIWPVKNIRSLAGIPCSFIVNIPLGPIRYNHYHLHVIPNSSTTNVVQQNGTNFSKLHFREQLVIFQALVCCVSSTLLHIMP